MTNTNDSPSFNNSSNAASTNTNSSTKSLEEALKSITKLHAQLITTTLDENNFLLWKFQVETAIRGYGLQKFIDPDIQAPAQFITGQDGQISTNVDFLIHQRQDSLLCS
jgi:hypothetical protein